MKRHSQPTRRACAGHPTSCHSPLCWVTLALPALLLFPPACSDDSANDLDAAMDRFVRPDGRPDRLVDAAMDRWVLPDGRPDYSIPDSSCIPETLPPEEIEPGLLIGMPPTGEYSMDSPMFRSRSPLDNPNLSTIHLPQNAGLTQLVECQLPKLKVAGSNPVSRSNGYDKSSRAFPDVA